VIALPVEDKTIQVNLEIAVEMAVCLYVCVCIYVRTLGNKDINFTLKMHKHNECVSE